jgi:hypothetical protein
MTVVVLWVSEKSSVILHFVYLHLGKIRVNNQRDALFNVFISLLYIF